MYKGGDRWFISFRVMTSNFLTEEIQTIKYDAVVTNLTPARWVREHGVDYHIQYAEKIPAALASELVHGGAGVSAEYFEHGD